MFRETVVDRYFHGGRETGEVLGSTLDDLVQLIDRNRDAGGFSGFEHGRVVGVFRSVHEPRAVLGRELDGRAVTPRQLIQAGLDALVFGADSPSLRELAGLVRGEEARAEALFTAVLDELGQGGTTSGSATAARWELVRWWLQLVADGELHPVVAGDLMESEAAFAREHPRVLWPLIGLSSKYDDWNEHLGFPRDLLADKAVEHARDVLRDLANRARVITAAVPSPPRNPGRVLRAARTPERLRLTSRSGG
ncbi:hypothetical protein [Streptomyces sp. NPDC048473]|uniref:hypothetical protein n=1 Tax=Streptomyces sp. NPDC048473 TaxID=3365556 RepID=UPI003715B26B